MAKKQMLPERNGNSNSPAKTKTKTKTRSSPKITAKNSSRRRSRTTETANGDASSEETEVGVVPSSSVESVSDEEESGRRSSSDEEEEEIEEKPKSIGKRGKKDDAKSKGKKGSRKEEDELDAEEKRKNVLYTFPMNRISQIIKSDTPDLKISQEAVFVINKASEKFLQLFCKEAHACTIRDKKKNMAYNHLSSVVSKRKRFEFLSDIIPEKVKVEDALAQEAEAEK